MKTNMCWYNAKCRIIAMFYVYCLVCSESFDYKYGNKKELIRSVLLASAHSNTQKS